MVHYSIFIIFDMESRTKSLSKKKLMTSLNIDTCLSNKRDCSIKVYIHLFSFVLRHYSLPTSNTIKDTKCSCK